MNNSHTTSQLIHAAVELVVGACITFWLNRKISTVSQKVALLEDKFKFYDNMLAQHHELIKKLFSTIENAARGPVQITKLETTPLPPASFTNSESKTKVSWSTQLPETFAASKEMEVDSTVELDKILSEEINDIKIDQTASLT